MKIGAEYTFSDDLALRCGYIRNQNATPNETFRPSLPDTDTHFITGGVGYRVGRMTIDAAVQVVFYETRDVDNNVDMNETTSISSIDGAYRNIAPCVSVSSTYNF